MPPLRRFLAAFYGYTFLYDFVLCYTIYTALFELEGLTPAEIGALIAFWSFTAILFEVPSGALSDWLDRRWLLVAAPLIKALTFVCWAVADGEFLWYAAGFALWSASSALFSGTGEALLFERLQAAGRAEDYDRALGRSGAAESLGIASGYLSGAALATQGMHLTLWWSIPAMLLAAAVGFTLQDPRRYAARATQAEQDEDRASYIDHLRNGFAEFRRVPQLRFVTMYIAAGLILFEVVEEFDQLYYLAVNLPILLFGVVGATTMGALALANYHAAALRDHPWALWALPAIGGLLFVVASMADTAWYVVLLELAYVVVVPATVQAEARFQALIEGDSRATATSVMVMAQNIVGIVVTLGFGVLADALGILPAYGWAALWLLPMIGWTFMRWLRERRASDVVSA